VLTAKGLADWESHELDGVTVTGVPPFTTILFAGAPRVASPPSSPRSARLGWSTGST
jgi:hypothetical protein